jgi:hypothetical protein
MTRIFHIRLGICISGLVEVHASTVKDTFDSDSNGVLQSSQQGSRDKEPKILEGVLVTTLDTVELVGLLVQARDAVEIGVLDITILASSHDHASHWERESDKGEDKACHDDISVLSRDLKGYEGHCTGRSGLETDGVAESGSNDLCEDSSRSDREW